MWTKERVKDTAAMLGTLAAVAIGGVVVTITSPIWWPIHKLYRLATKSSRDRWEREEQERRDVEIEETSRIRELERSAELPGWSMGKAVEEYGITSYSVDKLRDGIIQVSHDEFERVLILLKPSRIEVWSWPDWGPGAPYDATRIRFQNFFIETPDRPGFGELLDGIYPAWQVVPKSGRGEYTITSPSIQTIEIDWEGKTKPEDSSLVGLIGRYGMIGKFWNGLARVERDQRWFHIHADGTPVYEQRYDSVGFFSDGFATAKKDGKWFHIRLDGTPSYDERFDRVGFFSRGEAWAMNGEDVIYIRPADGSHIERPPR